MYAKYSDCDPFTTGEVNRNDELLPYYVTDVAGNVPGLPGLFIAGVVSAGLRYAYLTKMLISERKSYLQYFIRLLKLLIWDNLRRLHSKNNACWNFRKVCKQHIEINCRCNGNCMHSSGFCC